MQDEKRQESTIDQKINAMLAVCLLVAIPVMLPCRRWGTMGERLNGGGQMVLGCLGLLALVGLSKEAYLLPGVMFVLLILLLVHKGKRQQLVKRGFRVHSMYSGKPWLPGDEAKVKGGLEPALVLLAGMLTLPLSLVLGGYLMASSVCLVVIHSHWQLKLQSQVRSIRDSRIEHQTLQDAMEKEGR